MISADFPDLPKEAKISRNELARYRMIYVEELLQQEHGEFAELDRQVVESIARQDTISENSEEEFAEKRTIGEKLSDHLSHFGGSWAFFDLVRYRAADLDGIQCGAGRRPGLRPLSVHPAQSASVLHCGDSGADHHDEPEAAGGEGSPAGVQRLQGEPEG